MTNPSRRGSAPGRAQDADLNPGSFKPGHEKRGGGERGTPNFCSPDYRKAVCEAAYRVGHDGNGKNGLIGYLEWVALRDPRSFGLLLVNVLQLELAESNATPEEPRQTIEEINQCIREFIGLPGKYRTKDQTCHVESDAPWAWTGQDFPVGSLMHLAVVEPAEFCEQLAAMLPRPPTKLQRGVAARRAWEQRQQAGTSDDGSPYRRPVEENRLHNK